MDLQKNSEEYNKVYETLQETKKNLVELSALDLSNIHIGQDWSWIPYVKDHIEFLIGQVDGLVSNLKNGPPPTSPEELDILRGSSNPDLK